MFVIYNGSAFRRPVPSETCFRYFLHTHNVALNFLNDCVIVFLRFNKLILWRPPIYFFMSALRSDRRSCLFSACVCAKFDFSCFELAVIAAIRFFFYLFARCFSIGRTAIEITCIPDKSKV